MSDLGTVSFLAYPHCKQLLMGQYTAGATTNGASEYLLVQFLHSVYIESSLLYAY